MNVPVTPSQIVDNTILTAIARLAMVATPVILAALTYFGVDWLETRFAAQAAISSQLRVEVNQLSDEMPPVKERIKVLENNQDRGRQDRQEFQRQTTDMLRTILAQQSGLASQVSALKATIDAQQRELDKRR